VFTCLKLETPGESLNGQEIGQTSLHYGPQNFERSLMLLIKTMECFICLTQISVHTLTGLQFATLKTLIQTQPAEQTDKRLSLASQFLPNPQMCRYLCPSQLTKCKEEFQNTNLLAAE